LKIYSSKESAEDGKKNIKLTSKDIWAPVELLSPSISHLSPSKTGRLSLAVQYVAMSIP
jgi:hypothetical protein